MLKKLILIFCFSFVISGLSLMIQTNANAATGTTCKKSTTAATLGAIIISLDGVTGTQTYGSGPATKAPFNYADGIIDSDSGSNNTDACSQMPDEYKIKFYEVYLCSKDPYNENASPDFSSCTSIFSDSSGKDVTIKPNENTPLLNSDISIPIGSYPFIATVIKNHLNIKHIQEYVLEDETTAPDLLGNGDNGTQTGQNYCYSIAAVTTFSGASNLTDGSATADAYNASQGFAADTIVTSSASGTTARLDCTNSLSTAQSNAAFQTEVFDHLGDETATYRAHYPFASSGYESDGATGVPLAANMLKDDNLTIAPSKVTAKRMVAFFNYSSSPVVIGELTNGLNISFSTSSSVSIDFQQDTDGTSDNKIWGAKMGADPFVIRIETSTIND